MIQVSFRLVMLISILLWIVYRGIQYKKNKYINLYREGTLLVFLIYFLVLLNLTIFKYSSIEFINQFESYMYKEEGILGIINIVPFKETIATLTDGHIPIINPIKNIFGNILAFMPLGFLIPLLFDKYNNIKRIFLLGLFSSISIEVVQLFVGGNVSDIDDIIFNTSGAVLGFLCFKIFEKMYQNIKIKEIVDKIKDYNTENILKKSMKVILSIALISVVVYNYSIYNQTASAKLPDEELIKAVFKEDIGEYFLTLYSEYVEISEDEISSLYQENNGGILDIKFIDENNNEIKDMNLIEQ